MLKTIPNTNNVFHRASSAKCGEIYYQNAEDFTIVCTFCEMKIFEFTDFLLHFKNVHIDNNDGIKSENSSQLDIHVKSEKEELNCKHIDTVHEKYSNITTNAVQHVQVKIATETETHNVEDKSESSVETEVSDDDYVPQMKLKKRRRPRIHACEYCNKKYSLESHLKRHINDKHLLGNIHGISTEETNTETKTSAVCTACALDFCSTRRLESHIFKEHGVKCTKCHKEFRAKYRLLRHMDSHAVKDIKNFVCDFENCEKRFYTRRNLLSHKKIHTAPKNLICEICGYTCRIKDTLRTHTRTHTGEKPYACKICDKRFVSSSLLSEHRASHSTERPHVCEVCGATFARPKALYHHKHLHLDVKKFKCKLCGNSYAQAAGLAAHMRKHKDGLICS